MQRFAPFLALLLSISSTACGGNKDAAGTGAPGAETREEPAPGASEVAIDPTLGGGRPVGAPESTPAPETTGPNRFDPGGEISDAQLTDYHVALTCAIDDAEVGTITVGLWGDRAPITVRNFLRLCDTGFYDGIAFHRILRNFMVQGGDPTGTGSGESPYGTIAAEFSEDPARAHGYGVLSMARSDDPDSASSQFFLCCAEGRSVWGLDGKYASFGRITGGVPALEALADIPVVSDGREISKPTKKGAIVKAEVRPGPAPSGETIARPAPDLGDAPPVIVFQHALVSFQGVPRSPATRSREEAAALVADMVAKARAGEDFTALVLANSDIPSRPGDDSPSVYRVNNTGVQDLPAERACFELEKRANDELRALSESQSKGEVDIVQAQARQQAILLEVSAAQEAAGVPRGELPAVVADLAFSLAPGEVGVVEYDATTSPMGWHVIKRLE